MRVNAPYEIIDGIYVIGGSDISRADDAAVFLIDYGEELVMVDAGADESTAIIVDNITKLGLNPHNLSTIILTHCHIDHIGSAFALRDLFGAQLVIHTLGAEVLESGDSIRSAANWYGTSLAPTRIDKVLHKTREVLSFGNSQLHCLHAPGHTPGSIVAYLDRAGKRILFGQDIHGPFMKAFGSDIAKWRTSVLLLKPDILCEGHFGIVSPYAEIEKYINSCLKQQDNNSEVV